MTRSLVYSWQKGLSFLSAVMMLASAVAASAATKETAAKSAAPAKEAAPAAAVSKEPIKIGYIIPLSGSSAEPGQKIVDGMQLYMDQIHNQMAGRKVEIILENDESSPPAAMGKVRKLVEDDHCPILTGMFMSNILYAIAPQVENYKVPFVVVSAGADNVTQRDRKKWVVRTCYTGSQPAHPFGEYVAKKLGYKKIVTIASNYAYGYETVGGFQQTYEENGGKVIQKLWAPLGFKDFKELLNTVRKDADAIFLVIVGQSAEIIPKQIREVGLKQPLIGLTSSFDESFYPRMGDEMVGAVSASLYSTALDTPANKKFVAEYNKKYHEDPSYFSEHGYTAMMWLHHAVESLHGDVSDREKLLAALKKVELKDAPRGPVKLDAYNSSIDNIYVRRVDRVKGKLQNTVIFTYPNVSQFWKYNPEQYMKQPSYSKDYPPCKYCQ